MVPSLGSVCLATVCPFPPTDVLSMTVQCGSLYVTAEHCGGALLVLSEMGNVLIDSLGRFLSYVAFYRIICI